MADSPVLEAMLTRRSRSKVTAEVPGHDEIATFVSAVSRLADHGSLRPWRVIEIRGAARDRVGRSFAAACGEKKNPRKYVEKTHRASLLLAIVVSKKKSKIATWEQEAVAAGVAHLLSLLLDEAGWGVFWRTGPYTRAKAVRKAHRLGKGEELLGWLYVGRPTGKVGGPKRPAPAERHLSVLEP